MMSSGGFVLVPGNNFLEHGHGRYQNAKALVPLPELSLTLSQSNDDTPF